MRRMLVVSVLLGSLSWAQSNAASPVASSASGSPAAAVAPGAAVITIKGLCARPGSDAAKNSCHTVITREEFEKLSGAIQPDMPATTKRLFGSNYPRLLVMSHEAEQRGLDKQEHFQELMTFERLQVLSQELMRDMQQRAAQVPEKDVEAYYRDHAASFERATFERILVPVVGKIPAAGGGSSSGSTRPGSKDALQDAPLTEQNKEAMAKEADELHARAVAGEDFVKLQKEAYVAAGVTSPPLSPKLNNWRRGSLPKAHLAVFDLKVGEISPVISDATGHYIYKLDSKEMESLEEATAEIHNMLEKQRMQDMMKKVQESATTEMNQDYFGTAAAPKSPDPASVKPDSDDDE